MFKDRFDAAEQLAKKLIEYKNSPDVIIIAIPRGGLELGAVLSRELQAPLDVILSKKIGYPGSPEYAIGAVSLEGIAINPEFAHMTELQEYISQEVARIRQLLRMRDEQYHKDRKPLSLTHKIVIVVDDGVATGQTLAASLDLIHTQKPKKIIVALPVACQEALSLIEQKADEVICLEVPQHFLGVSQVYRHFNQVEDEQAINLLKESYR